MRINIESLNQGSKVINETCSVRSLGLEESELEFADASVELTVRATRMGDDVLVDCRILAVIILSCSRCLEEFPLGVDTVFQSLYVPAKPPKTYRRDVRRPFTIDEDDKIVTYKGKKLDLSDEIHNAICLFIPMRGLCGEECRGLCSNCGVNLNEESCSCAEEQKESGNNPFKNIQNLFDDK